MLRRATLALSAHRLAVSNRSMSTAAAAVAAAPLPAVASPTDYSTWSKQALIARLEALELGSIPAAASMTPVAAATPAGDGPPPVVAAKKMTLRKVRALPAVERRQAPDLAHLPLRKVAFKLSYLGAPYCGLAIQPDSPLPTVEGVLLEALEKSGLIDRGGGWEACGFARCGRTDRGVSAAGQVVNLWLRSRVEFDDAVHAPRRPDDEAELDPFGFYSPSATATGGGGGSGSRSPAAAAAASDTPTTGGGGEDDVSGGADLGSLSSSTPFAQKAKAKALEFPYVSLLNRLLPPTIRLLAWSPLPPAWHKGAFDARHSCSHRHYKYFFTLASSPSPTSALGRPLDLAAMRLAASYLEGEHDYRNFCKVDGSKQITSHRREILAAKISAVPAVGSGPLALSPYSFISPTDLAPSGPAAPEPRPTEGSFYVLDLLGKAFLYHQVRHIMAVLFLVGSGLESPEVVKDMFRWETKPAYEMASDQPLVLWDCGFPEGLLDWQYGPQPLVPEPVPSTEPVASAEAAAAAATVGTHHQEDARRTALALSALMAEAVEAAHTTTLLHAHFLSSFLHLHPHAASAALPPPPSSSSSSAESASAPTTTTTTTTPPANIPARLVSPPGKRQFQTFSTPLGANTFKLETVPRYVALAGRKRGEHPELANRAWRLRMEGKGHRLKLVGGGKVVKMDKRDTEAGRVMHGVKWVEPEVVAADAAAAENGDGR